MPSDEAGEDEREQTGEQDRTLQNLMMFQHTQVWISKTFNIFKEVSFACEGLYEGAEKTVIFKNINAI